MFEISFGLNRKHFNLDFNPIRFRLFLLFKGLGGLLGPPKISGTTQGSPMKLCNVIELLKVYQNT